MIMENWKNRDIMDLPGEMWKDIQGYEGLYQVSSLGRVKSLERKLKGTWKGRTKRDSKILAQGLDYRYPLVTLHINGIVRTVHVHRLVAETFLKRNNLFDIVNHLNEVKTDNRASNLEWCTQKENVNYGTAIKRRSAKSMNNPRICKPVAQCDLEGSIIAVFPSQCAAARAIKGKVDAIQNCAKGRSKSSYGYKWKLL